MLDLLAFPADRLADLLQGDEAPHGVVERLRITVPYRLLGERPSGVEDFRDVRHDLALEEVAPNVTLQAPSLAQGDVARADGRHRGQLWAAAARLAERAGVPTTSV